MVSSEAVFGSMYHKSMANLTNKMCVWQFTASCCFIGKIEPTAEYLCMSDNILRNSQTGNRKRTDQDSIVELLEFLVLVYIPALAVNCGNGKMCCVIVYIYKSEFFKSSHK